MPKEVDESMEEIFVTFENSVSQELFIFKRTLQSISEALKQISQDVTKEAFYLQELRGSEDPTYQEFIAREYGFLLGRYIHNHEILRENYKRLSENSEVWQETMEKLKRMTDVYPQIDENIKLMWEILSGIIR